MEQATYKVGDKVEVTIHGKTSESTVTDVILRGSHEPVWMYQVSNGHYYKDFNLKPVERNPRFTSGTKVKLREEFDGPEYIVVRTAFQFGSEYIKLKSVGSGYLYNNLERADLFVEVEKLATPKFKVGDTVQVKVADWGLGSTQKSFTGTVEKVTPRRNDALYEVNGIAYAEHWLRPAPKVEFKFNVGDKVAHVGNLKRPYVVRERFVLDGKPRYKFEGYNIDSGYPEHVYVPFEETSKFKVGDEVRVTSRPNGIPRNIVDVVVTDSGTVYFLDGRSWPVPENELVLHKTEDMAAYHTAVGDEVFRDGKVKKIVDKEIIFANRIKYADGTEEVVVEREPFEVVVGD